MMKPSTETTNLSATHHEPLKATHSHWREPAERQERWSLARWQARIDEVKAAGRSLLVMEPHQVKDIGPDVVAALWYAERHGIEVVGIYGLSLLSRIVAAPSMPASAHDGADRGSPDEPSRSASTDERPITPRQRDELVSAYHEGWTVERLAAIANLDIDAVRQALVERGVRIRGRSAVRIAIRDHVRSRHSQFTLADVQAACGVSRWLAKSELDALQQLGEVRLIRSRKGRRWRKPLRYRALRPTATGAHSMLRLV